MLFTAGCLSSAFGLLCYSGDKITCSDYQISGIERCVDQSARLTLQMGEAKRLGICSQDGSSCSGPLPQIYSTSPLPWR